MFLLFFILPFILLIELLSKNTIKEKSNDLAGVKLAAKQDLILDFQKKYLPQVLNKIGQINIPDQQIEVDVKIGTLHIYLSNINFSITNLLTENISVGFNSPNFLQVSANQVTGNGNLQVQFKLGFIRETDRVNVNVNRLDASVTVALETIESKLTPGKLIPSCTVDNIQINLDFDFDIHGSFHVS